MYNSVATFIRVQQGPGGARVFTLADTLTYTTTFQAGVTSLVVLAPLADQFRLTRASAGLTGLRSDVHKLRVTMAAGQNRRLPSRMETRGNFGEARLAFRPIVPRSMPGSPASATAAPLAATCAPAVPPARRRRQAPRALELPAGSTACCRRECCSRDPAPRTARYFEQDRQRQLELQRQFHGYTRAGRTVSGAAVARMSEAISGLRG